MNINAIQLKNVLKEESFLRDVGRFVTLFNSDSGRKERVLFGQKRHIFIRPSRDGDSFYWIGKFRDKRLATFSF